MLSTVSTAAHIHICIIIDLLTALTEAQVRTQLIDDEKSAAASGNAYPHETTPTGFIILALTLEESQYVNLIQIISIFTISPDAVSNLILPTDFWPRILNT